MGAQHILRAGKHHAAAGFTLPTVGASPVFVLPGSGLSGLSDAAAIGTWADTSGNGRDATQATAGNKPTKRTIGGKPCALFTTDDWIRITAGSAFITGASLAIFTVFQRVTTTNNQSLFLLGDSSEAGDFSGSNGLWIGESTSTQFAYRGASAVATQTNFPADGDTFVVGFNWDGATPAQTFRQITTGGGTIDKTAPVPAGSFNIDRFLLGARWTGSAIASPFSEYYCFYAVAYAAALSSGDFTTIGSALATEYL